MNNQGSVQNLRMDNLLPSSNGTNRTLSLDISLEPTTDTSSSVLVFDPLGSLVAWTIIEAVAVGFLTTAAFKSLHHNYHHGYHKPYSHSTFYIPETFYDYSSEDILDLSEREDNETFSGSLKLKCAVLPNKQKGFSKEVHDYVLKGCPISCSKKT
ncbi:uncharacterized protein CEXT_709051 [Caerostris extrusa]|uniref:Uncharacterized protein n=1 Tax=Caerostris extrusa TaxID=172846 RepID=A0AAV4S7G3_CAEEX|nr:uncharacterized protein CEXT_709051 [Caerostris extrusa]